MATNKSVPYTVIWNVSNPEEQEEVHYTELVDKATSAERAINKLYARLGENNPDFSKATVLIVAAYPTVIWLPVGAGDPTTEEA